MFIISLTPTPSCSHIRESPGSRQICKGDAEPHWRARGSYCHNPCCYKEHASIRRSTSVEGCSPIGGTDAGCRTLTHHLHCLAHRQCLQPLLRRLKKSWFFLEILISSISLIKSLGNPVLVTKRNLPIYRIA